MIGRRQGFDVVFANPHRRQAVRPQSIVSAGSGDHVCALGTRSSLRRGDAFTRRPHRGHPLPVTSSTARRAAGRIFGVRRIIEGERSHSMSVAHARRNHSSLQGKHHDVASARPVLVSSS